MEDKNRIVIADDEAIELPFHMISADTFAPDVEQARSIEPVTSKDERAFGFVDRKRHKEYKMKRGRRDRQSL